MTGPYATAVIVVSLLLCLGALVLLVADKSPSTGAWILLGVLELMIVVFAVGGVVQLVGADHDVPAWEFVGYLAGLVAIVPAAAWWVRDERSRAAAAVLVVVLLVVPFLVLRVQQVWAGTGG